MHGFWSSPTTWDRLLEKIENDAELKALRVHRFGYPSPKFRLPGVPSRIPDYDDIAQMLPVFLEVRVPGNGNVAVVTHSQGGLIVQRFLSWMLREGRGRDLARIRLVVMLACPNEGADYLASIRAAAGFSVHPQAKALRVLDTHVAETRRIVLRQIINADHVDERHCPIPFYVYSGASDNVVRRASAQSIFPQSEVLPGDHFSILNPNYHGSLTFDVLKRHLLTPAVSAPTAAVRRVKDSRSRIALNIHPAIGLYGHHPELSTELPEYVPRAIDKDLRSWIRGHSRASGLILLVGDAAAGKTRCLYEALSAEIPDWKMLHPSSGEDIAGMVHESTDLSSSVLWLDELQNFFADGNLTVQIVRRLLLDFGPLVVAATIRAEELDKMLAQPDDTDERKVATQHHAREINRMLTRWSGPTSSQETAIRFDVENRFGPEENARAAKLATVDPRIREALRQATDGNVTATLAGAPELIARWISKTGDPYGRAVITAAVIARRCGHPEPLPAKVLESLAVAQLAAEGNAPLASEWLQAAIAWAERPVESKIAALRPAATTPGVIDGYKVSDILLQYSYNDNCLIIRPILNDPSVWALVLEQAAAPTWSRVGDAAYAEGHTATAEQAWHLAAGVQDLRAMRRLGWLYTKQDRQDEARRWFEKAIALEDIAAMYAFSHSLGHFGQFDESLRWMRRAAERGDLDAMADLGFHLQGIGQVAEAETWYRRAASFNHPLAMTNLGYLLEHHRDDAGEAEEWTRKAAILGHPGAMQNLAHTLRERGQTKEALQWLIKSVGRALRRIGRDDDYQASFPGEGGDEGTSNAILQLAELFSELGQESTAERCYRRGAELGDGRAASALADLFVKRGLPEDAAEWRKKAAELSHANLSRNKRQLLFAYGDPAIQRHVGIIEEYVRYLDSEGDSGAAYTWRQRATGHLAEP
ncbi:MAG: alpha/beta fold hydrolase [Streptosporangiaceae bacterium]